MATEGSDCVTGKVQFATRAAASAAASGMRHKGWHTYAFRCQWCDCYHVGNRRGWDSKSRKRKQAR